MNLLFASSNKNKIKEIQAMMSANIQLFGLADINFSEEIPETSPTIEENAIQKANFIFDYLKNNPATFKINGVFADDSGLEVDALNGEPGVYSARYAGVPKNDDANNKKLLQELKNKTQRNAQFKTVIAYKNADGLQTVEGIVKGTIAFEPRGKNGFGYDPLFIPRGYRSTFAELDFETKNAISHRANAIKHFLNLLQHH